MSDDLKKIRGFRPTKAQIKRYLEEVQRAGEGRAKVQGKDFSPVDFAMGASVFLFATDNAAKVPVEWVVYPMRGKADEIFEAEQEGDLLSVTEINEAGMKEGEDYSG